MNHSDDSLEGGQRNMVVVSTYTHTSYLATRLTIQAAYLAVSLTLEILLSHASQIVRYTLWLLSQPSANRVQGS